MIPSYHRNKPLVPSVIGAVYRSKPQITLVRAERLQGVCRSHGMRCEWLGVRNADGRFIPRCEWHGDDLPAPMHGRSRIPKCNECLSNGAPRRCKDGRE